MDSIEAKTQQFHTSIQSLYTDSGIEDLYKDTLDIGNNIVKTFTEIPKILNAPIPAIAKFGTQFTTAALLVTKGFAIIKTKLTQQNKELNLINKIANEENISEQEKDAFRELVIHNKKYNDIARIIERGEEEKRQIIQKNNEKNLEQVEANAEAEAEAEIKARARVHGDEILKQQRKGMLFSSAGLGLSMLASNIDVNKNRGLKAGLTGAGAVAQTVGAYFMGGGGVTGGVFAAITAISGLIETLGIVIETSTEKIQRLKEAAQEANNEAIQKNADAKALSDQIKKYEELEKAQYDSVEARKEFIELSNQIAESHPELVSGYDSEGNAIINLTASYHELANARQEALDAAKESAEASAAQANAAIEEAEKNRPNTRREFLTNRGKQIYDAKEDVSYEEQAARYAYDIQSLFNDAELAKEDLIQVKDALELLSYSEYAYQAQDFLGTDEFNSAVNNLQNSKNQIVIDILNFINGYTQGLVEADRDIATAQQTNLQQQTANLLKEVDRSNQAQKDTAHQTGQKSILNEMAEAGVLIDNYMTQQFKDFEKSYEAGGKYKSAIEQFNAEKYDTAYETIYKTLNDFWNASLITSTKQGKFSAIIANRENYTQDQFIDKLTQEFPAINDEIITALSGYYTDTFNREKFEDAIQTRQNDGSQLIIDEITYGFGGFLDSLGSNELRKILDVYDNLSKQVQNNNITENLGQNLLESYLNIWDMTREWDEESREMAQSLLSNGDLFSLNGLDEFRKAVNESGLGKDKQKELEQKASDFTKDFPVNFAAEIQSFGSKLTSGMSDFEKAISSASSGMNFEDATKMAQRLDIDLSKFTQRDGKFFLNDFDAIQKSYLGDFSQYTSDLQDYVTRQKEQIESLKSEQGLKGLPTEMFPEGNLISLDAVFGGTLEQLQQYQAELSQAGFDYTSIENAFSEFTSQGLQGAQEFLDFYAQQLQLDFDNAITIPQQYVNKIIQDTYLKNGLYDKFINSLGPMNLEKHATLTKAFKTGDLDTLLNILPEYANTLVEVFENINNNVYNSIIQGIQNQSYIKSTAANDAFFQQLTYGEDAILQKIGQNIYEFVDDNYSNLATRIDQDKNLTQDQKDNLLKSLHTEEYENNIYDALSGVAENFDNFSYETGQSLARAVGTSVEQLLSQDILTQDAAGNLSMSYEQIIDYLNNNISNMTMKQYNELRAKVESTNNKQKNEVIFADIIKNRDSLNEEMIANLANIFGFSYDTISKFLHDNGNGTKSINLANIQALIEASNTKITEEIAQLIATEIDNIVSSITGLAGSQSKGFTDLGSMQKYISTLNKLGVRNAEGAELNFQDMFTYDNTLRAYRLSSEGLIAQIQGMNSQLDTLTGEQKEIAEKLISDTEKQFAEQIDVDNVIDAIGTNQISLARTNFRKAVEDYNAVLMAMAEAGETVEGLDAEALLTGLQAGGSQAVEAIAEIASRQGQKVTAEQAESAYRSQIVRYTEAIDKLVAQPGEIVDQTTALIIDQSGGAVAELGNSGTYLVQSAANLYQAYNNLLNEMRATGEATLADLNNVAAMALENRDDEQQAIDTLGDAANMTYTRFGEILAQGGYELTENLVDQMSQANIIKQLGGSKMQIIDFSAFADFMGWQAGSPEYVSAFKSYNDSMIEMNRQVERNILEEAKGLENAKPGDKINLTQLSSELSKILSDTVIRDVDEQGKTSQVHLTALQDLSNILNQYGAELKNGILSLSSDANIPAIIQAIASTAQQYGGLLSSEMAQLADVLANVLKGYTDLISGGISGTLSNTQAQSLQEFADQQGMGKLDFSATADGLKVSTNNAIALYSVLSQIDSLQGSIVLDKLVESLSSDQGGSYEHISDTMAEMAKLQKQIKDNQTAISQEEADMRSGMGSEQRVNALKAQNDQLKEQLGLLNQIANNQSVDPNQFNFMNRKLSDSLQGPLNYWNSVGKAYKAINQAGQSGYMEVQDYVNIINEMANLVEMSSGNLEWMGMNAENASERASELITAGLGALKNIDGSGAKIALGQIGIDMQVGAEEMSANIDLGVKEVARGQIAMLDAAIQILEAIVAMEQLGNIGSDGNGVLDLGDIFKIEGADQVVTSLDENGKVIYEFTKEYNDWRENLLDTADKNKEGDLYKALNNIKLNNQSLYDILKSGEQLGGLDPDTYFNVLKSFNEAAKKGDFNLEDIQSSVWQTLSQVGLPEGLTVDIGDYTIGISGHTAYQIDWTSDNINDALEYAHQKSIEDAQELIKSGYSKWETGEQLAPLEFTTTLIAKGLVNITDDGYSINWNGQTTTVDSLDNITDQNFLNAMVGKHLADALHISESDVTVDGGVATTTIEVGNKLVVVSSTSDGEINFHSDSLGRDYHSQDEMFQAEYQSYLEHTQNLAKQGRYIKPLTFDQWVYVNYNIHTLTQTKVVDDKGQAIDLSQNAEMRQQLENALSNNLSDLEITVDSGLGTVQLDGGALKFNVEKGEDPRQKAIEAIKQALGIDTMSTAISTAISEAFSGDSGAAIGTALIQGIADGITTMGDAISSIELGELPNVGSALGEIATQAQTLSSINWAGIAQGLTGLVAPNAVTPFSNANVMTPGLMTGTPIKTDKVEADSSTIEASGATVELDTPTITAGSVNITGSSITVTGNNISGNNNENGKTGSSSTNDIGKKTSSTNESGQQSVASLDLSGLNSAISAAQSALDSLNASSAQSAASAFNSAMKSTMNSVPSSKTVKINVTDATAKVKVDVDVNARVNVTGATATGTQTKITKQPQTGGNISTTHAKGNVALARGKGTLVGELGPELVVSGGRYYIVGENGAEFVELPEDAIVFNHLQTKKLLGNRGKVSGRGNAVTSERNAVSFATGSVEGPALASAAAALAQLRAIRAMWQSMFDASAKDLGSQAGRGGGGGGGGGGGKDVNPTTTTEDIQRWYNWLRQIDRIEQDISYQETLQNKLMSDRIAQGRELYRSYKQEMSLLDQEIERNEKLADLQKSWYDNKRKELEASSYGKIFTYDEYGLQQYVGSGAPGSGLGLDILENLTRRNVNGEAIDNAATSEAQLKYLAKVGFDLNDLLFNDDGTKIGNRIDTTGQIYDTKGKKLTKQELADAQTKAMENFWSNVDAWRDELDSLFDSYREQQQKIIENQNKQNELMQKLVDNEMNIENQILETLVDIRQRAIDELQKQRDVLQKTADKYIKGLSDQLSKERELYNQNQNEQDLTKMQRQLAILQRSGGSASQITNLQNQILDKQKNMYFDERQSQIDAIQEASDLEIERLDEQIDIMTETLEYQKDNGLLWQEVRSMMDEMQPEDIANFILGNNSKYWSESPLSNSEALRKILESIQMFAEERDEKGKLAQFDDIVKDFESAARASGYDQHFENDEARQRAFDIARDVSKNTYESAIRGGKTVEEATEAARASYMSSMHQSYNSTPYMRGINSAANQTYENYIGNERLRDLKGITGSEGFDEAGFRERVVDYYKDSSAFKDGVETTDYNERQKYMKEAIQKAGIPYLEEVGEKATVDTEGNSILATKLRNDSKLLNLKKGKTDILTDSKAPTLQSGVNVTISDAKEFKLNKDKNDPEQFLYATTKNGQSGWFKVSDIENGSAIYNAIKSKTVGEKANTLDDYVDLHDIEPIEVTGISGDKLRKAYGTKDKNFQFTDANGDSFTLSKKNNSIRITDITGFDSKHGYVESAIIPEIKTDNGEWRKLMNPWTYIPAKPSKTLSEIYKLIRGKSKNDFAKKKAAYFNAYAAGGLVDYTGPAWVDGTPSKPEAFLSAEETKFLKNALLQGKSASFETSLANIDNAIQTLVNATATNGGIGGNISIDRVELNMNVDSIANDYDAKRAGANALEEIVKIARKSGTRGMTRR